MKLGEFVRAENLNSEEKEILKVQMVRELDENGRPIPVSDETGITEVLQNMFMKELAILRAQRVKVVGVSIPFGDVFVLAFQSLFAGLIIAAIPVFIILAFAAG